jgi:hypothetical protein
MKKSSVFRELEVVEPRESDIQPENKHKQRAQGKKLPFQFQSSEQKAGKIDENQSYHCFSLCRKYCLPRLHFSHRKE